MGLAITGTVVASGATGSAVIPFTVITTSQTLAIDNGYFTNGSSLVTGTLPTTSAVGDEIVITAINAIGWKVAQNASQFIQFGNVVTTTGVTGFLSSLAIGDTVSLICSVANTQWVVISSQGNITYN